MAARGGALDGAGLPPIDVLIVVALQDELDAVLAEGGGAETWRQVPDHVHVRTLENDTGQELGVAAAWTGAMGSAATATRAATLIERFRPSCIAMCGICAGKRGEVALGDVIVADRVYNLDHGKLVAAGDAEGPPDFFHDITTYNLERAWQMDAAAFGGDLDWADALLPSRPPTKDAQARWLLRTLHAHESEGGHAPLTHPERDTMFPRDTRGVGWSALILELREKGLLEPRPGLLKLTEAGRDAAREEHVLYPDRARTDPPFRVHVGPIATGNAVIEDPKIFDRLKRVGRKTLGIEMEAFAIGYVGAALPQRAIVVKAVSDHADHDKDDRFRGFACRASAGWLLAFLKRHLSPKPPESAGSARSGGLVPRSPFPDLARSHADGAEGLQAAREQDLDGELHGVGDLQERVKRALAVRHPDARTVWKRGPDEAPAHVRAFLEVQLPDGWYTKAYPVAVVDGEVDRAAFDGFVEHIVVRYRRDHPFIEPLLVYTGGEVSAEVGTEARRHGVRLESLLELQGLLDFRPYVAKQTSALENDPDYPSSLFVPQRIEYRLGFDERAEDDALEALDRWLGHDGPQLALVLGDFGTGKTFLMHELALRLGRRQNAMVPILVELRKLEKSRTLGELLGQHFVPDRGMERFDHTAFRYMLEEGRIALLFDGFDELALRVTYEAATEHLETVLQAAIGKAKIVITSRTQHFLSDKQVLQALGKRVEQRGFRMMRLSPFDEDRIQKFLVNRFDDAAAKRRLELLGEVKDLLGLSHNPRMLGFIAAIEEKDLRQAAVGGEITSSATLYRALLEKWLGHEVRRDRRPGMEPGASDAARWKAATALARLLWNRKDRTIAVSEIPLEILDEVERLSEEPMGRAAAAFKIGSATLLGRDEVGRFSFIHQSIVEWLVANAAADELREGSSPALLASAEMSDLMADFLWSLAGKDRTLAWVREVVKAPSSEILAANANRVLQRLPRDTTDEHAPIDDVDVIAVVVDMSGHDLRGRDFSGTSHLRGAMLERANLSEASLVRADLSDAVMAHARLQRANFEGANLAGVDLTGADLSFVRLMGADLTGAKLAGAKLRYAGLVGTRMDPDVLRNADAFGAAPPHPRHFDLTVSIPLAPSVWVTWSPDGALLAAGYQDGTVVIWDAGAGSALRVLEGHSAGVTSVAFSPDGRLLASGSAGKAVRLWSPETGKPLRALEGHSDWVRSVAFSPDGRLLASASDDRTVRMWSPDTGKLLRVLEGHSARVRSVAFSPDGRLLASASDNKAIQLWSPDTGELLRTLEGHSDWTHGVAFSPDGRLLASASDDHAVRLWSPDTGRLLRMLEGHHARVRSVAFSPDGRVLASASGDKVQLWSPDTGKLLRPLEGHLALVHHVTFSPDGRVLALASDDKVQLWSPDTGKLLRSLEGHSASVHGVAFSPDGRLLASASDHKVRLWSPSTGKLLRPLEGHFDGVRSVAFSPDSRLLASGSADKAVRLWSPDTGQLVRTLGGHADWVRSVAFSSDGRLLASASDDKTVRLWNANTGLLLHLLEVHSAWVRGVAFSPSGRLVASASDKDIRLWSPDTGKLLRVLEGHSGWVTSIAFSPNGRFLASGSADKIARLWSPETGMLLRALEGHAAGVTSVAFSLDGLLASGSADKAVRLWSPDTGKLLCALEGHSAWVTSVAISPDGRLLASGSADKAVRLWSIAAALDGGRDACLAVIVPGRTGWAAYTPDGRYKLGGDAAGLLGFTVGLCRFEPGELDAYPDAFDRPPRRIPEDEPLFTLDG